MLTLEWASRQTEAAKRQLQDVMAVLLQAPDPLPFLAGATELQHSLAGALQPSARLSPPLMGWIHMQQLMGMLQTAGLCPFPWQNMCAFAIDITVNKIAGGQALLTCGIWELPIPDGKNSRELR